MLGFKSLLYVCIVRFDIIIFVPHRYCDFEFFLFFFLFYLRCYLNISLAHIFIYLATFTS